jgi:CDP-glycerol glycerophosphotransferase (TagB/SpsB family)
MFVIIVIRNRFLKHLPYNYQKKQKILLYNPDYSGEGILVGEQHFCNTECMYEFINKEKETK